MDKNPILITGSHRSGSTWVGRVIESCNQISYYAEPMNPNIKINRFIFEYKIPKLWFPAIDYLNDTAYLRGYKRILNGHFPLKELFPRNLKELKYFLTLNYKAFTKKRVLLKDPISLFSSEWIYDNFDTLNIVLIRGPEAFISSLKKNKWTFNFNNLLKQNDLIDKFFFEYKDDIELFSKKNDIDIIDQGILLWNIIHTYIYLMIIKNPNWYFVSHEALSKKPILEFKKIFQYLNLDFDDKVIEYINKTTNSNNPSERLSEKVHVLERNSKETIYTWRKRLTKDEIEKINIGTKNVHKKLSNFLLSNQVLN